MNDRDDYETNHKIWYSLSGTIPSKSEAHSCRCALEVRSYLWADLKIEPLNRKSKFLGCQGNNSGLKTRQGFKKIVRYFYYGRRKMGVKKCVPYEWGRLYTTRRFYGDPLYTRYTTDGPNTSFLHHERNLESIVKTFFLG